MEESPENFFANIHNDDYLKKFHVNLCTHAFMLTDYGRKRESLNGEWNFTLESL